MRWERRILEEGPEFVHAPEATGPGNLLRQREEPMGDAAGRRELLELIVKVSFRRGKFRLASGRESDFYLDLRHTLRRPRGLVLAGELVLGRLQRGAPVDAVGGMAVGAVPLVAGVLAAAARRDAATPAS